MEGKPEAGDGPRTARPRYELSRKLDVGGMAEIYLGKALGLGGSEKAVAIKRVLPDLARHEKFIAMFLDEARLSMRLNHGNIVQVFDVGRSGEAYFLVMEYVEGHNLREVVQRATETGIPMPVPFACHVMIEVCKGLAYAHGRTDDAGRHLHIVHRDLSPPNILVSIEGEVKITDFGLAKARSHLEDTEPGVVKGRFSYLSPEATDGKPVDQRADIFAVGVCLWELLSGRRLFLGKDDVETVERVRAARVPSLSTLQPDVSPDLEAIVCRALAQDPKRRYATARELGDAMAHHLFEHKLKVTSFDVAHTMEQLFSPEAESDSAPGERIAALVQEELLNLSMFDPAGEARIIDGSQPIHVDGLDLGDTPRIDLSPFWGAAGVPSGSHPVPASSRPVAAAMETVASPGDLVDMLEGGQSLGPATRLPVGDPVTLPPPPRPRWPWALFVLAIASAIAALGLLL